MTTTKIEWADEVWNPTTGCDKVSEGCGIPRFDGDDIGGCYAMAMAKRLKAMEGKRIEQGKLASAKAKYQTDGDPRTSGPGFGVAMHPEVLTVPFSWRQPRRVFVNSMSDLFHEKVTDEFIAQVFAIIAATPQHTYQILTKRHGRMRALLSSPEHGARVAARLAELWHVDHVAPLRGPLPNVWLGVSVETQRWADIRIPALLDTPAAVRWISAEPLLGPLDLVGAGTRQKYWLTGEPGWCPEYPEPTSPTGIPVRDLITKPRLDWVVVGGESGRSARPMHPAWARSLRNQCEAAGVPFLFKQRGAWTWEARLGTPDGAGRDAWADREPDAYVNADDGQVADEDTVMAAGGDWAGVYNVGKQRAGRELDRELWDQYPAVVA